MSLFDDEWTVLCAKPRCPNRRVPGSLYCAEHRDEREPSGEAHARRGDPETSHEAARALEEGDLRDRQRYVLYVLRRVGPLCDEDIAKEYAAMGFPPQSPSGLRTRRRELVDAEFVRDSGMRVLTRLAGKRTIVWEAIR